MAEQKNIEQIKQQVSGIQESLNTLKNEANKKNTVEFEQKKVEQKNSIQTLKNDINISINTLKNSSDAQAIATKTQYEQQLKSIEECETNLQQLGTDIKPTNTESKKSRLREQRDKSTDSTERKEHPRQNAWRVAAGVGAVALTWKLCSNVWGRLSGESRSYKKEFKKYMKKHGKTPRYKKPLVRLSIIGTGIATWKISGWLSEKMGRKLTFEEALWTVQSDIAHLSEKDLYTHMGKLEYKTETGEICSYDEATQIDKDKKMIPGLGIEFGKFEELIHAANLINYVKKTYRGRCAVANPFNAGQVAAGDIWGDIYVKDQSGKDEVISGGIMSTLSDICPPIAKGNGRKIFCTYLNSLQIWWKRDQPIEAKNGDPVHDTLQGVIEKITKTPTEPAFESQGNSRYITAEKISETSYLIKSWGQKIDLTFQYKGDKITDIHVADLPIIFSDLEEAIRVANLTNKLKSEYAGKCVDAKPFVEQNIYKPGICILLPVMWKLTNHLRVISDTSMKQYTPTMYEKLETYIKWLNELQNTDRMSLWKKV